MVSIGKVGDILQFSPTLLRLVGFGRYTPFNAVGVFSLNSHVRR